MRLFLDANVLFTAAISPDGASRALVRLARRGSCALASSRFAIDEATRNVAVKRRGELAALDDVLASVTVVNEPGPKVLAWAVAHVAAKDGPILAAAAASRVDMLVTGDRRHFGSLYGGGVGGLLVLPPREALEVVLDRDSSM